VPDSASTATALFGGVKTNYEVVGVDANVQLEDCEASLNENFHVDSFIAWAQASGKATGPIKKLQSDAGKSDYHKNI